MKTGSMILLGTLLSTVVLQAAAQDVDRSQRDRGITARNEFVPVREERPDRGERPDRPDHRPLLRRADTDDDGLISEAEFVADHVGDVEERFMHRDTNGDGTLDRDEAGERERPGMDINIEELRACIASYGEDPDDDRNRFDIADTDGDGLLTLLEFSTYLQERAYVLFARLDANVDGYISPDELQADMDERDNHRRIVKACMEEVRSPLL